ncbi:putative FimV domain protein [Enhydrobacter aerosaccus SK60]|nr:putative FimV domain protein [Enhydrobacter aerosaccus SK60]
MIGIAAVVILVIVAGFFLMKKGKSQTTVDTQTQVKRPKTLAEQQRELELQRQSQMPSPAAPDLPQTTLQTAQTLNLNAQAHNLKTLVDEDQSINARSTAMTHTAEAVESDGLDFDLPGFKQDSDKPAINSTSQVAMPSVTEAAQPATLANGANSNADNELDFDFALDVPETKIAPVTPVPPETDPTTETTAAQSQSNELTFDDFDFDPPSKEPAATATVAAPALESPTEIFAPIDEPVTTASASNVNNNAISDSDFDFDFSLPDTPSTTAATAVEPMATTSAAPSAEKLADDFDFDFELNVEPAVTPTNDVTAEAALNLDASDTKASSNLTYDAVTSVPVASDEATDIASFALDDELLRQAEAASLAKPATPSVAEPVVDLAEVNAPKPSDSLLISDDMFDLSFDDSTTQAATPANTQTTTTPIASPKTTSIADKASLTTAPVVEDLSAILDVIKDIDTDTLNVDLAEQYVNLGEYDSAKRLLDEIKDSNNTALVERATALRQRIA